ncbi:MAG: hypothetical protein PHS67_00885 [Sphaerochaetaceae bacterium]|nr:hypothetical protein [Sphaerochaetaceae bacterium]MDY0372116.1 hypothetical protein [Sphaerochaetaceae bacterium]
MKKLAFLIVVISFVLLLSSCLPTEAVLKNQQPAGFLLGIWHGWIAPFSLILGLFMDGVRIYSPFNTGWWYDAGFYVAIISGFGGLSLIRNTRNKGR